ncbi:hypothetical protein [Roseibium sp.]|uniref:hypothetical protein n=1 Tax=Roseibium sp. TaxID=1936156 RepID=UPI003BA974B5
MDWLSAPVTTAIISACVSLAVSGVSFLVASRKVRADWRRFDRQLTRELSAKLFELRLSTYGQAFEITDKIRKYTSNHEFEHSAQLRKRLHELREWRSGQIQLILSRNSIDAFRDLEAALGKNPGGRQGNPEAYTTAQIDKIFDARTNLRRALRSDIEPLHVSLGIEEKHYLERKLDLKQWRSNSS